MMRKRKIGVALSGGAARALSHVGVLEVLEELGVEIKAVSGTSMGSVIGSLYCSGVTLAEIKSYVRSMDWKSFLLFSDMALSKTGIINGRRVEEVLRKFLGNKTFDDCRIPFCCTAVDLITREKVILSRGKLLDAVRASISIPGFFSAVYMDNKILVDGGIVEPLPTDSIKIMDVNFIIASSIIFEKDRDKYMQFCPGSRNHSGPDREYGWQKNGQPHRSARDRVLDFKDKIRFKKHNTGRLSVHNVLDTSFNIIHREMTKNYLDMADIVIEPEVGDFGFFDLTRGNDIIGRGIEAARKKIPEIKRKLNLH